ncbi:hypothetical protein PMAYCL1PPCAC_23851, partial [Pristionchus mayeri]
YVTMRFGVIEGAENAGHIHFAHRVAVGSRRRHRYTRKPVFDVTTSGANGDSGSKMNEIENFLLSRNLPDLIDS